MQSISIYDLGIQSFDVIITSLFPRNCKNDNIVRIGSTYVILGIVPYRSGKDMSIKVKCFPLSDIKTRLEW